MKFFNKILFLTMSFHISYGYGQEVMEFSLIKEKKVIVDTTITVDSCHVSFGDKSDGYFIHGGLVDSSEKLIVLEFGCYKSPDKYVIINLQTKKILSTFTDTRYVDFEESYFYKDSLLYLGGFGDIYEVVSIYNGKTIQKIHKKDSPKGLYYREPLKAMFYKSYYGAYIQSESCKYIIDFEILRIGNNRIEYDEDNSSILIKTKKH